MKIEIRSRYWPATPNIREIKVRIDNKEVVSSWMDKSEILDLSNQLKCLHQNLLIFIEGSEK